MGQNISAQSPGAIVENTIDTIRYNFNKNTQNFKNISSLTHDNFTKCLNNLNEL